MLLVVAGLLDVSGDKTNARRIRYVVGQMKRRPAVRVTPVRSKPITPAIKASMRRVAATTDLSQAEIGRLHGTNGGRVSEAIAGKRR